MVDTLKYLAMGGRIGKVQALLGGVLQFNPIVGIRDGETHPVDRPRTRRRAQRRIIELVRELAPIHQLHLSYSTGRDKALDHSGRAWPTSWSRNAPSSPRSVRSWVLTSVPIPSAWQQPRGVSRKNSRAQGYLARGPNWTVDSTIFEMWLGLGGSPRSILVMLGIVIALFIAFILLMAVVYNPSEQNAD